MLIELRVENLLLIEQAQLRLAPGLNVLTGETGAGKTVLAHALDLLLGGRARAGIVRPGAQEAYVEGVFELSPALSGELGERLPADAQEVVLARRVGADGRTRAYLNGRAAAVGDLRELGESLLSFYGQHEHRKLTVSTAQREILDEFCGAAHLARREACAASFRETQRLEHELEQLRELGAERERELDLLEHELGEIEMLAPEPDEHAELSARRERLRRLDALCSAAGSGAEALAPEDAESPGAVQLMAAGAARLDALTGVDPALDALNERYRALVIEAEDLAAELHRYGESFEAQDDGLQGVEERLQSLERLMRKHGGSIGSVLEHAEHARARRALLRNAETAQEETSERLRVEHATLDDHVQALRKARARAAPRLAAAVRARLSALAMPDATFDIELLASAPGITGGDSVEFLIAPNPGVAAAPVREIASGGELSRVMLALSTADVPVAGGDALGTAGDGDASGDQRDAGGKARAAATSAVGSPAPGAGATLVFDEVDAGIGGHTARAVGECLRALGEQRQVLCITHLPQIASLGARHFSIVKDTSADPTRTTVVQLGEPEVVSELVRMLGAEERDPTARKHARELRRAA
ncbi:MAG TPA: DNA repair protein RecN [Solirubrobacteraceae bacterium]|nr:DNA repair protein RecN [Solirubrobacteraceae bacterium]